MTVEEAIRILDPETEIDVLDEIEYYGGFNGKKMKIEALNAACRLAISALRASQEVNVVETISEADMKPCPFCGGKPITRFRVEKSSNFKTSVVCTVKCGECGVSKATTLELLDTDFDKVENAMLSAVKAWNRRSM